MKQRPLLYVRQLKQTAKYNALNKVQLLNMAISFAVPFMGRT
jgi:hypothetical protein